jgi:iron complex outermembrane receptor protein
MKTQGLDVTLLGRPTKELTINIDAIYTKAYFAPSFRVSCAPGQPSGPADQGLCETLAPGVTATKANPQITAVPKFKLAADAEYAHEVSPGLIAFVQSDLQYQTKTFTTPTPDPIQRLPAEIFLNGSIGVRSSNGRWSASVWGRNLLGKRYVAYVPDFLSFAPGHAGAYLTGPSTAWKTTVGITLTARY